MDEGDSRGTASLSLSLSLRELRNGKPGWGGGGAPLLGNLEGVYRKALEMALSLHRGPTGESGRGLVYQGC
jgi:hypothetical protein